MSKCMSGFTDEFYKSLHARFPPGGEKTSTKAYPGVEAGGSHARAERREVGH